MSNLIHPLHSRGIRSLDLSSHAAVGRPLTNARIDALVASGWYGSDRQRAWRERQALRNAPRLTPQAKLLASLLCP